MTGAPRDAGSVTAELGIGLLGVVVVLAAVLATGAVAIEQLRVTDAARAGARAAARAEPPVEVRRLAGAAAGSPVSVQVRPEGDLVRVTVSRPVRLPLPGGPSVLVEASAAVPAERPGP